MFNEIQAVMWKEWNEFFIHRTLGIKIRILLAVVFIGIIVPLFKGPQWFNPPGFWGIALVTPVIMTMTLTSGLFAGEKERHTLESLLATKISIKGLVLGKIAFTISYAFLSLFFILIFNLLVINLKFYSGVFLTFSIRSALIVFVVCFAVSLFGSVIGCLISARSQTIKEAQTTISLIVTALLFLPVTIIYFLPATAKHAIAEAYSSIGLHGFIAAFVCITALISVILLQRIFSTLKSASVLHVNKR